MSLRMRRAVSLLAPGLLIAALAAPARAVPPDPEALVTQGRKLSLAGNQDGALALYRQALALRPSLFDAHLGAGIALDLKGDYAEARTHLAKAIELAPPGTSDLVLGAMGVSYAFQADAKDAAVYYERLFDEQVKQGNLAGAAATANALGRVYLESGIPDQAATWYQRGYDTAMKQTGMPAREAAVWDFRLKHAAARIAVRRGDVSAAERDLAAVKAIVDRPDGADQKPDYFYLEGYVDFYAGRYRQAIAVLEQASQKDPFLVCLLAQSWEKAGDRAKALEYYRKVLAINSHDIQNAFARPLATKKVAASEDPVHHPHRHHHHVR
ncbi:MAG: tetratricopeptide repeat protein [Acidobacteriota bacterium]|nr:tetratricopeptide repeat protein [Acidobacteriota bacterium]